VNDLAVRTVGLTKRFGSQTVVDAVDLAVPPGAVYGFLGPNGSGKTTTIRMLLGLVTPTAGDVALLGAPMPSGAERVLPAVGALVEGPAFHPYLSGRANLSRLDEPTNGLDPQGTREVRQLVGSLAGDGATVLVSSHLLSEVEQMCSHLGVMHVGRMVAQGTSAELRGRGAVQAEVETQQPEDAARVMRELGLSDVHTGHRQATGSLGEIAPEKVVAACVYAGVAVVGFRVGRPTLEDIFVALTGEGFDVSG
jgi:ABC-2 type transport system ATP-binding protein